MSAPEFHALELPPDALEKGGHEVVRVCVVDGGLSVALRRSFDDAFTWGVLLVDLARHAARTYALETGISEAEAFEHIREGLESELARPTDLGETKPAH